MMNNSNKDNAHVLGINDFGTAPSSSSAQEMSSEQIKHKIAAQALTTSDYLRLIQDQETDPFKKRAKPVIAPIPKPKLSLVGKLKRQIRRLQGKTLIEILRIEPVCHLDDELFWGGHIDFPKEQETHSDPNLYVAGWVIGKAAKVAAVRITIDNQDTLAEVPLAWSRSDVMKAYCFIPGQLGENSEVCGFKATVSTKSFPDVGSLRLQAIFKDGRSAPLGYVKFCRE